MRDRPKTWWTGAVALAICAAALFTARTAETSGTQVMEGKKLFAKYNCFVCHGENGNGGIKNPNAVGGEVPALTRVADGYTPAELQKKILAGVRDIKKSDPQGANPPLFMPPWKKVMTQAEAKAIGAYLFSLQPKGEGEEW